MVQNARAARSAAGPLYIPSYSLRGNRMELISLSNGHRATRRRMVRMLRSLERSFRGRITDGAADSAAELDELVV